MRIIFCADPLNPRLPDAAYEEEANAASAAGFGVDLISFERLVHEADATAAVRRVAPARSPELAVYRGWMLRAEQYIALYAALLRLDIQLINTPEAYRVCHELPSSYPLIAGHTPRTVHIPLPDCLDPDAVMAALVPFASRPLILKDYVKSRKHEWLEACYIPSAANRNAVERVVQRFLELQGDDLTGGLVFREYIDFQPIGTHSQSGMPLTREYRTVWVDSTLLAVAPYWDEMEETAVQPSIAQFQALVARVPSRFFTIDLAQRTDSTWMIVELGDAQVAGLPPHVEVGTFYRILYSHLA